MSAVPRLLSFVLVLLFACPLEANFFLSFSGVGETVINGTRFPGTSPGDGTLPTEVTYQVNVVDRQIGNFIYSAHTGMYADYNSVRPTLNIPDSLFAVGSNVPASGETFSLTSQLQSIVRPVSDQYFNTGVQDTDMKVLLLADGAANGILAPGDKLIIGMSAALRNRNAGYTLSQLSKSETFTTAGSFTFSFSGMGLITNAARDLDGVDQLLNFGLSIDVIRGNSTETTSIFVDPGTQFIFATAVPEPSTSLLFGLSAILAGSFQVRRKRRAR